MKLSFGRGSTPDPSGGAQSAPQTPWLMLRGSEGRERKGEAGRRREMERDMMGREGDRGIWSRAAYWLRPALPPIYMINYLYDKLFI